ncbi:unnamed protein product [Bursaphelenchus xylophilus]|uniref:(pine wood nematode) hypothetical protein n=1 Tax=Bursaphelenchus xylophilus TaxID=6326 RepID=A0A1I7RMF6_BURXY|nr:unnamed protein product [Bursaphelenchus xylophilus]CAG9118444.1 unnamed protein product [Bursaphelenchus xylophilus]
MARIYGFLLALALCHVFFLQVDGLRGGLIRGRRTIGEESVEMERPETAQFYTCNYPGGKVVIFPEGRSFSTNRIDEE